ncbi:MAG TPA: hypothetical protein PK095_09400, partial [Myxococcota bacterium]|nr:hypothetical protein [Myxococcota bacterium]
MRWLLGLLVVCGACDGGGQGEPGGDAEVLIPGEVVDVGGDVATTEDSVGDVEDAGDNHSGDTEHAEDIEETGDTEFAEDTELAEVIEDSWDTEVAEDTEYSADSGDTNYLDSRDSWISSEVDAGPEMDVGDDVEGPSAPAIAYRTEGPRRLFFLNNPEQLLTTELGDSDLMDTTLLRVTASGPSRSFFEHVNKSGRTIGFGVQAYNPGPQAATIAVEGVGYTVGIEGGRPFAAALSGEGATTLTLNPGQSSWLLRRDESVPSGSFFSGVVDFTVTGSVVINHIAYDRFDRLDGSTAERDYVTRIEPDGTSEARMYKGVASASEAALELAFTVDDGTATGPLPVSVRRYDLASQRYGDWLEETRWLSHIGPSQNAASSVTDMVSFVFRAWTFDPLVRSDAEAPRYRNLSLVL